jgi:alpha-L-fucosidase
MEKAGYFMEDAEVAYTPKDIRFTAKGDTLYATCLGWPDGQVKIESYKQLYEEEIESVTMLGFDGELKWSLDRSGLTIAPPPEKPGKHAFVFKVERRHPYGG